MKFCELKTQGEFKRAFPLMHELRDKLDESEYIRLINRMRKEGYRLFALIDLTLTPEGRGEGDTIVGLIGFIILTNLYYGKHIWINDLVVDEVNRSKGYGGMMISKIEELARSEGCKVIALSSGIERIEAHRFYEKNCGFERTSLVFRKKPA